MSSQKKRRLEGLEAPKPMSAISALAARRREAANAASQPEVDDKPIATSANFFSPLKNAENATPLATTPKKGTPRSSRRQRGPEPQVSRPKAVPSSSDASQNENTELTAPSRTITQFSSFRPSKKNHRIKDGGVLELRLEESERFLVLGSFGIRVLRGEVNVAGASFRASETVHWVHAPSCHAIPVVRSAEKTGLELYPDPCARGLRQLGRLSPLFRKMWNEPTNSTKRPLSEATFQILYSSDDAPKGLVIQDLVSPPEWNKKLASLVSATRKNPALSTIVSGPKSAGKSTFSRLLTNRLVTDHTLIKGGKGVVILDLDPGQPEYAPPGLLALVHVTQPNLSAPFSHPGSKNSTNVIIRYHALASVTPASDPGLYLACVKDLYEAYCETFTGTPLIVNTPGWILGTGLDLLSEVIGQVNPDEVLYMSEDGPLDTVDVLQSATKGIFAELPSQQSEFTSRTAAHFRAMQALSYFHLNEPDDESLPAGIPRTRWNPSPLTATPPLIVGYSSPSPGILGFLSYDSQVPPELLADTINGTVLAAVEVEDPRAFRILERAEHPSQSTDGMHVDAATKSTPLLSVTPEGLPFIPNFNDATLDPKYSRAIGLVLLRGIDTKTRSLQLLTPISLNQIRDIRSKGRDIVLVYGRFDAPNWAYTEDLYEQDGNDEWAGEGVDIMDEDTDADESDVEPSDEKISDLTAIPWVEVLKSNQRRPIGSKVWRVRRDLGRNTGD